jgi:type IX secretion system PorP/SprF family membrane protein
MMKQVTIIICFLGCVVFLQAQQQQMYTQFMYNKLSLNPAYAGNEKYLSSTLLYRDQWSGLQGAPSAQVLTVNLPRIGKRVGLGLNMERQALGITEKLTYEAMYAYKFLLGEGTLSMGMNVSGRKYIQDFANPSLYAVQGLENDPSIPSTSQTRNVFNAGFGIYYSTNRFFLGGAIPRMIRSDLDFDTNNAFSTEVRHLLLMSGATFLLSNDARITPQFMFRAAEKTPWGIDLNCSLTWKDMYSIGATYRTGGTRGDLGESLDFLAAVQLSERMLVGFAYDATLSKIRAVDNGSLEVVLNYNFIPRKIKTVIVNPRYF